MVCVVQAVGLLGSVAKATHEHTRTPEVCGRMEASAPRRRDAGTGRKRLYVRSWFIGVF